MGVLLRDYDKLKTRVGRLPEIISDYKKFRSEAGKTATKRTQPDTIYRLEYDEMTGALRINGVTVHKCNIDSKLDIAIIAALKAPSHKVVVRRNLRADISHTDIPKPLQKVMFKTGKTVFQVNPEVTLEDLERHKLDRATIDTDLQKLL